MCEGDKVAWAEFLTEEIIPVISLLRKEQNADLQEYQDLRDKNPMFLSETLDIKKSCKSAF